MTPPGPIHVACAADERYAPYCAGMLHSLLVQHPDPGELVLHFLHGPAMHPAMRERLQKLVTSRLGEIHFHEISDHLVAGLPSVARLPVTMWYRIFLPQLLPQVDRVLYLDVDTFIIGRLDELWKTPLDGCYVAAVQNVTGGEHQRAIAAIGLDPKDYFNSGVLLMNLALMRDEHCTAQVSGYGRNFGAQLAFPDQDALNMAFAQRWRRLHPRWNCMNSLFYLPEAMDLFSDNLLTEALGRPAILHFEGPSVRKPWHFLNDHPFRDRYYVNLRASGWPVPLPEGITLRTLAIRYLPEAFHSPLRNMARWLSGKHTGKVPA